MTAVLKSEAPCIGDAHFEARVWRGHLHDDGEFEAHVLLYSCTGFASSSEALAAAKSVAEVLTRSTVAG